MGKDEEVEEMTGVNYPTLRFNSLAAGVIGIATSILCLIYETVVIILRFLNIGLINYKIKIFLAIVSCYNSYCIGFQTNYSRLQNSCHASM